MADDKKMQDGRDRSKVSGTEDYEVSYLAEKLNVPAQAIRDAIKEVGNSRELVEAYIRKNRSAK